MIIKICNDAMKQDYFSKRVSVRNYSDKIIPESQLTSIIERAMRAPTCGNMQLYSVILTKDQEKKQRLAELHFNQPAATGCDTILTICADFNRFSKWCKASDAEPCYSNFHSFIMAMTDAVIFTQQIVTIAEQEGIGTCYLGTVNYNANEISDLLDLPRLVVPVASLSLGFPASLEAQPERLPVNAIIHKEKYVDYDEKRVTELFKVKDENPENIHFIKENGKKTLAQVFTDIRYPKNTNESVSESFHRLLDNKGFI